MKHKRRTDRSISCPWLVLSGGGGEPFPSKEYPVQSRGYPIPRWLPQFQAGGIPVQGRGYPSPRQGGCPRVPPGRICETTGVLQPRRDLGPMEVLWNGDGVPPPQKGHGTSEVLWDGDGVNPPPGWGQIDWRLWKHYLRPSFGCGGQW